jgi:hypothetical protein
MDQTNKDASRDAGPMRRSSRVGGGRRFGARRARPAVALGRLLLLAGSALAGLALTCAWGLEGAQDARAFGLVTTALLAVGLYAATADIDLGAIGEDRCLIVRVLTIGVGLKVVLIGAVMVMVFGDWRLVILAPVMAQIDPLSVSALERDGRMSDRARRILDAWASFDDPFTILITWALLRLRTGSAGGPLAIAGAWGLNLLLAGGVIALIAAGGRLFGRQHGGGEGTAAMRIRAGAISLGVAAAVWTNAMLSVALVGLFVGRPGGRLLKRATLVAVYLAAVALGVVLAGSHTDAQAIVRGATLGGVTYGSQAVVAPLLTRRLPNADRRHLALGQQNGITAILLAILVSASYGPAAATAAVAILVVYLLHLTANTMLDLQTKGSLETTTRL